MIKFTAHLIATALALSLSACSTVKVSDYSDLKPAIVLDDFFSGSLSAHGVVKDRSGRVIRMFNASIDASWDAGTGTLDEDFIFNDGEKQRRVWKLQPQDDGSYIGTAGDVEGEGLLTQAGNSVFLDYVLQIPYGEDTVDVRVDDRMYLVSPGVLINESQMTKFGVRVGSILLVILRQDSPMISGIESGAPAPDYQSSL
jgi:hypothetical protein